MFVFAVVLAGLVAWWFVNKRGGAPGKTTFERLSSLPDFTPDIYFLGLADEPGIAIDVDRRKIALIFPEWSKLFQFSDIVSSEPVIRRKFVPNPKKEAKGRFSAKGKESGTEIEKVTLISLKVFTTSMSQPIYNIPFFKSSGVDPDALEVQAKMKKMEEWHGRLLAIVHDVSNSRFPATKV